MKRLLFFLCLAAARAQLPPDTLIRDILAEVSVENALSHTRALSSRIRYPNSASFFEAAEYVAGQARSYGLENVRIERFESKQPLWDPLEGELDMVEPLQERLSSLKETSLLVAQNSKDGDVTAELIDVGSGSRPRDYEGKDVKGKVILARGEPGPVWAAMGDRGAVGMLCAVTGSYFGRRTAPEAVYWGQAPSSALAMMISPKLGEELRRMITRGQKVKVRMHVLARRSEPGAIGMVMGEIPGTVRDQDVVLVAHLDHQKPGANDNASGSGTLLEVLRLLNRLIAGGNVPPLQRSIRFWWSTEIISEEAYFRKYADQPKKILLGVNLDQAGGDRHAENNFIVISGPDWLPSYADDLMYNLAEYVKEEYAPAEHEPSPLLVAAGGGTESMRTVYWDYAPLSDHLAFEAKDVGIPCISLAVPSLHVIHTDLDTADRLDPTWMKRSALLALAPALFVANAGPKEAKAILDYTFRRGAARLANAENIQSQLAREEKRLDSVRALDPTLNTADHKKKLGAIAGALEIK